MDIDFWLFQCIFCCWSREAAESYTFIDVFNNGASHQPRSCPALIGQPRPNIHREAYSAVPDEQVFQRMVNNLIQCSRVHGDRPDSRRDDQRLRNQLHFSRLSCVISPGQTPSVVAYAELCAFLRVQLEEAIQLLLVSGCCIREIGNFKYCITLILTTTFAWLTVWRVLWWMDESGFWAWSLGTRPPNHLY